MTAGICPFAVWRPTANFGYHHKGATGENKPLLFVDHIMGGYKRVLDDPGWREPNGVGVTFGIGRDGSISQYTNIFDAHWGNGVSGSKAKYDRTNRHLAALEKLPGATWNTVKYAGTTAYALAAGGVNLPNSHSISIEHEGIAGQQPEDWPDAMVDASVRAKQWCLAELEKEGVPMVVDEHVLAGHFQIDGVHRVNCPGAAWPKARILAALQEGDEDLSKYEEKARKIAQIVATLQRPEYEIIDAGQDAVTKEPIVEIKSAVATDDRLLIRIR